MSAEVQGRALRPSKAAEHLGIGVSTFWRYAKTIPDFPKPVKLSPRCTIFFESQLNDWLASRAAAYTA
ncbi:helix-turn-helix transcriptional regulator [Paraburkholderia caledonica]|uniref:Prophage regulatory protein n=1 Tax=Paraburkholderia caledonica TaxID=134536 RepID=A0ABU1L265_9BURK|nr:AlpA family phage regulatory protein [Paraburkholderia caledonica]MDR6377315.1 prophage regulatory protein [Paraburkholderia caledonica]